MVTVTGGDQTFPAMFVVESANRVDYGKSTLARGSRCHYVTANGVRNGLQTGVNSVLSVTAMTTVYIDRKKMHMYI